MNSISQNSLVAMKNIHVGIHIYLLSTIFLFFFGPWNWEIRNETYLILFITFVHVSIYIGYVFSKKYFQNNDILFLGKLDNNNYIKYIHAVIYINLFLCLPTSLSRTDSLLPDFIGGLEDLGRAYNVNYENNIYGNPYAIVEYIRIILSPFLIGFSAIVVFFWSKLSAYYKSISSIIILFYILIYVAIGTNKGIADLVFIIPFFAHIYNLTVNNNYNIIINKFNLFALLFFIIFLVFFGLTQDLRIGNVGSQGVFNTGTYLIFADPEATPSWMGRDILIIYQSLTRYITSGYQALVFSFEISNHTTLGVGNSMFAIDNIDRIFGLKYFSDNSYPSIIEMKYGWSSYFLWHTAYVWFISDFGYLGTIILICLFSYIFFKSIYMIILYNSILHVVLCQQLLILFLYLPANNQVFQNGEGYVGTIVIFILAKIWEVRNLVKRPKISI